MKALDTTAAHTFAAILNQLGRKRYLNIDNAQGTYMSLSVDRISRTVVALAHNSVQNGDIMADPDMQFWTAPNGKVYPCTFQNDYLGQYQESVILDGEKPSTYNPRLQASLAEFANQWMRSIASQQGI